MNQRQTFLRYLAVGALALIVVVGIILPGLYRLLPEPWRVISMGGLALIIGVGVQVYVRRRQR